MNMDAKLAWRYLSGRLSRTILTTGSVVLGVLLLVCMGALMPPIAAIVKQDIEASKVEIDIMVSREGGAFFSVDVVDKIRQVAGAEDTVGTIERSLRLPPSVSFTMPDGRKSSELLLELKAGDPAQGGQEWQDLVRAVGHKLAAGREIVAADSGKKVAIISQKLGGAMGLGVGDMLALPSAAGTTDLQIVGLVAGARATVGKEQVYTTLVAAQEIFNAPGQIDHILGLVPVGYDLPAVQAQVKALLPPGFRFGSVSMGGGAWDTAMQMAEIIFTAFGVLALLMAGLIMFNTFRIAVIQRRHDIGMLRAIGASRRSVVNTVLIEAFIQGALGTLVGIVAGYLLVWAILPAVTDVMAAFFPNAPSDLSPEFPISTLVMAVVLGLGIPLLSGWWPARAAGRLSPMEALRPIAQAVESRRSYWRIGIGSVLILVGLANVLFVAPIGGILLIFIGFLLLTPLLMRPIASASSGLLVMLFASEGHLAERNLSRQPGRAAVTVSTVAIGMAIIVTLSSFITSSLNGMLSFLDQSLSADYMLFGEDFLTGSNDIGAKPEFSVELAEIAGVSRVATLRRGDFTAEGVGGVHVMAIDPVAYPQVSDLYFIEGERDPSFQQLGEGRTVIVNAMAAAQGNLKPGDSVTLDTINGPKSYKVVANAVDFLNVEAPAVYISQANGEADFDLRNDAFILINLEPGVDTLQVENRILKKSQEYPSFDLNSSASLRATQEENFAGVNIMYSILMLILAIPTLLALANTLTTNVLERVREIGVLRAIGSQRKQVRRMVLAEGLMLALLGSAIGLLGGMAIGWFGVEAIAFVGLPVPYHFPLLGVWLVIGCGVGFGALASLAPASRAAKQNIVAALAYE